jgi:hypothetical protein
MLRVSEYIHIYSKSDIIPLDITSMPIIRQASDTQLAAYYEAGVGQ